MTFTRYTGFILGALLLPSVALAVWTPGQSLVPCGGASDPHPICKFEDFLHLGKNVIDLGLYLVIFLAPLSFAAAGFRYITSFGSESEAAKVHGMVTATVKGVFLAFFAWLLVSAFFNFFVNDTFNPFK